jgi:hypothetical protein
MPDSAFIRLKRQKSTPGLPRAGKKKTKTTQTTTVAPSGSMSPAAVLDMQRRFGNRAVQTMIDEPSRSKGDPQERFKRGDVVTPRNPRMEPDKINRQLDQVWDAKRKILGEKDVETGVASNDYKVVHPVGNTIDETDIQGKPDSGMLDIYRTRDEKLAQRAGEIAKKWKDMAQQAETLMGRARGKTLKALVGISQFSKSRALALAVYADQGAKANELLSREFAITVYQLAAVETVLQEMRQKGNGLDAESQKKQQKTKALTKWTRNNQSRAEALKNILGFDPRNVSPQKLIAELHKLGRNKDPELKFVGTYAGR